MMLRHDKHVLAILASQKVNSRMLGKNSMQREHRPSSSSCDTEHLLETAAADPRLGNAMVK